MNLLLLLAVIASLAAPLLSSPSFFGARTLWYDKDYECPTNEVQPDGQLPDDYISPALLLPISATKPDVTFAVISDDWAYITPNDVCMTFNLELPVDATQGKICNLVFDFPSYKSTRGTAQLFGPGHFNFIGYAVGAGAVEGVTTYYNQPPPGPSPPNPPEVMRPGNSYVINSAPCGIPPETPESVTVSGSMCSPDSWFLFKQTVGECPLGFYVVLTDDSST